MKTVRPPAEKINRLKYIDGGRQINNINKKKKKKAQTYIVLRSRIRSITSAVGIEIRKFFKKTYKRTLKIDNSIKDKVKTLLKRWSF